MTTKGAVAAVAMAASTNTTIDAFLARALAVALARQSVATQFWLGTCGRTHHAKTRQRLARRVFCWLRVLACSFPKLTTAAPLA
jgi:hypothetical protein